MNTLQQRARFCLSTLALAAMGALTASYANAENYSSPGLNCVEYAGGWVRYLDGMIHNDGSYTNTMIVQCPIQRRGLDTANVTVHVAVSDSLSDEDVECHVRSCEADGGTCIVGATASSSGTPGVQEIALGAVAGYTDGYALIRCWLPRVGSTPTAVLGYRWSD